MNVNIEPPPEEPTEEQLEAVAGGQGMLIDPNSAAAPVWCGMDRDA